MALSEARIREITRRVIEELGARATPDNVRRLVREAVDRLEEESPEHLRIPGLETSHMSGDGDQLIITVFGRNKPGVLAAVARCVADFQGNVVDVSQKLLLEWFTLILVVDGKNMSAPFVELQKALRRIGEEQGMQIHAQHERVFTAMHRI